MPSFVSIFASNATKALWHVFKTGNLHQRSKTSFTNKREWISAGVADRGKMFTNVTRSKLVEVAHLKQFCKILRSTYISSWYAVSIRYKFVYVFHQNTIKVTFYLTFSFVSATPTDHAPVHMASGSQRITHFYGMRWICCSLCSCVVISAL
jgi:hypothetical protein